MIPSDTVAAQPATSASWRTQKGFGTSQQQQQQRGRRSSVALTWALSKRINSPLNPLRATAHSELDCGGISLDLVLTFRVIIHVQITVKCNKQSERQVICKRKKFHKSSRSYIIAGVDFHQQPITGRLSVIILSPCSKPGDLCNIILTADLYSVVVIVNMLILMYLVKTNFQLKRKRNKTTPVNLELSQTLQYTITFIFNTLRYKLSETCYSRDTPTRHPWSTRSVRQPALDS